MSWATWEEVKSAKKPLISYPDLSRTLRTGHRVADPEDVAERVIGVVQVLELPGTTALRAGEKVGEFAFDRLVSVGLVHLRAGGRDNGTAKNSPISYPDLSRTLLTVQTSVLETSI